MMYRLVAFLVSLLALPTWGADLAVLRERLEKLLPRAMEAHEVNLWLVFTREESRDPLAEDLGGGDAVARMALLFDLRDGRFRKTAIAASYDVTPLEESGLYDKVLSYKSEGIKPHLKGFVTDLDPARIAVNMSRDMPIADGLTSGMRAYLEEVLGEEIAARFVSSEPLVASFRGRRLPQEVEILREAARHTDTLIREALSILAITPGVTSEEDVGRFLRTRTAMIGATVPFVSVVAGPSRGHADPSSRVIERGDLVRIDFGITLKGYSTDLQRTAYVLRTGETEAPEQIQKMWKTARRAANRQIAAMKPGVSGTEIDSIARKTLEEAGFEGPPHGTGHAIGFVVHDVGPLIGPDWRERYGTTVFLKMEEGQTFAVEPILYARYEDVGEIHIGLEEDVVITKGGAKLLHEPQTELILIN
jgi:Xaa-Pro aminopeptidase